MLQLTSEEQVERDQIVNHLYYSIENSKPIPLPRYQKDESISSQYALQTVALQKNPFGGKVSDFLYQFEGEEDLLHLMITRIDQKSLEVDEARSVVEFLLKGMPWALIWLRPGKYSQHFYFGHDDLVRHIEIENIKRL